jgi:hypothetical protein
MNRTKSSFNRQEMEKKKSLIMSKIWFSTESEPADECAVNYIERVAQVVVEILVKRGHRAQDGVDNGENAHRRREYHVGSRPN